MRTVYKVILSKIGVNRSVATIFRYAPKSMNGLGLPHIFIDQGCSQIKSLLSHINTKTKLGGTMSAQLESCSIELGSTRHMFTLRYDKWSHILTNCWTNNIWKFADLYSINLKGDYSRPHPLRERDIGTMDIIIENNFEAISNETLRTLNRCRLYLQIVTLADILDVDGVNIDPLINSLETRIDRKSSWVWPEQVRPLKNEWTTWLKMVEEILEPYIYNIQGLGNWIKTPHQRFQWKYSPTLDTFYFDNGTND